MYELFQSGWSGAEYRGDAVSGEDTRTAILSASGSEIIRKKKIAEVSESGKQRNAVGCG